MFLKDFLNFNILLSEEELKKITWTPKPLEIPEELCFLYGEYMEQYLQDVAIKWFPPPSVPMLLPIRLVSFKFR